VNPKRRPLHALGELDALLKELKLAATYRRWPQLVETAEKKGWSCQDFLRLRSGPLREVLATVPLSVRDKTIEVLSFTCQSTQRLGPLGLAPSADRITEEDA